MLSTSGGSGGDKKGHKTLSPYREIKDLRSYYPRLCSVAGSKEGGRKPPHPATPYEPLTERDLVRINPLPKELKRLIKKVSDQERKVLVEYIRSIIQWLVNEEFEKVVICLQHLDLETIKFLIPSITEGEFEELRRYLTDLYLYALRYKQSREEFIKQIKTLVWEKLPIKQIHLVRYGRKQENKLQITLGEFLKKLYKAKADNQPWRGYRNLNYRVALFLDKNFRVKDARIYATDDTLKRLRVEAGRRKLYLLVQPNPVVIPKEFWKKYRKAYTPEQRVKLIRQFKLLSDEQAFYIALVLDIDSPYEEVEKAFKEFLRDIGIKEKPFRILLEKTASDRARLIILLKTKINPKNKNRNGHTNFENIKEALAILAVYFQQKGLNVDLSFVDRPNHQIWDRIAHPKNGEYKVQKAVATTEKINFYEFYNLLKKLQKEKGLYYLKRGNDKINLTTYFGWRPEYKKTKKAKVLKAPKFIAERLSDRAIQNLKSDIKLYYWKKAVKSLADKVSERRYNRLIRPAVGWAKYLDLDRYEVESYLKEVLSDRDSRKNDHDIAVAWREAPELEFRLPEGIKTLDFKALVKEALKALAKGEIARQELIKILGHQKWLTDLLTKVFEEVGLITSRFVKVGRGRPRKVFALTEKGRLVVSNLNEEAINELWRVAVATAVGQDFSSTDFSQYKNSSKRSTRRGVGLHRPFASGTVLVGRFSKTIDPGKGFHFSTENSKKSSKENTKQQDREGNQTQVSESRQKGTLKGVKPKDKLTKVEKWLGAFRKGKPKRGDGISSLGEILGFD
jgi:predicted transcriptional regulator